MSLTAKRITFVFLMMALLSLFAVEAATGVMSETLSGLIGRNTPAAVEGGGGYVDSSGELPPIDAP
jgi:hypothetical protein